MQGPMIKIGSKIISEKSSIFIIAEAGVNHNGKLNLALKMIDEAKKAGVDAIKFQTWKAEQLVIPEAKIADYQRRNLGKNINQLKMLKPLELKEKFYKKIIERCKKRKIIFLSTPHGGIEAINYLQKLKVPAFKFGSGDLINIPVLRYAARFKKPMVLGTGMANMEEIKDAISAIKKAGNKKIVILHCTTNYPCPFDEVNLRAMQMMRKKLNILTGYSDHTLGIQVPIMASALGACVVEKHFTLSRKMVGPDHKASLEPRELKEMVEKIRIAEKILGDSEKRPTKREEKIKNIARKSIVSLKEIKKGERLTIKNIGIKRPGIGIPPKYFNKLIGKIVRKNIKKDFLIKLKDLR